MKMKLFFVSLVIVSLVFFGCGKKNIAQNQGNSSQSETPKVANVDEAVKSGKKMVCTYKDNTGVESKIYIDNGKYKSEYTDGGKMQYGLFDGTFYYYWQEGDNKGYKISHECLDELVVGDESQNQNTDSSNSEGSYNDEVNKYDTEDDLKNTSETSCQIVSSVDLSLPESVDFTDQCDILIEAKKAMEDINSKVNDIFDKAP